MSPTGVSCHHHSQQTDGTSRFSPHVTVRLATKPKMPISRPKNNTKNYTNLSSIFNPNICAKMKRLPNTANFKVGTWYLTVSSPLNVFPRLYFSHFIRPSVVGLRLPRSRPKRILGNSANCRATQYYQQNIDSIEFLLLQTRPNYLGRSCNSSTKRPERQLQAWASNQSISIMAANGRVDSTYTNFSDENGSQKCLSLFDTRHLKENKVLLVRNF